MAEGLLLDRYELAARRNARRLATNTDTVLVIGPPFGPAVVAAQQARRIGVPYVADIGDPWVLTGDEPYRRLLGNWRQRRAERWLWAHAAGAIVTTPGQAAALRALFPALRLLVRPNGYEPVEQIDAIPSRPGTLRLAHFGNLYATRLDLAPFMGQLVQSRRWNEIHLTQYGYDWTNALEELPTGIIVERAEPMPWGQVVGAAVQYDAAIVVGHTDPAKLPSKAVQYLTLPIPRLALCAEEGDALWQYAENKPGYLRLKFDQERAAELLAQLLSGDWTRRRLAPPSEESWSIVADEIVDFIESVCPA